MENEDALLFESDSSDALDQDLDEKLLFSDNSVECFDVAPTPTPQRPLSMVEEQPRSAMMMRWQRDGAVSGGVALAISSFAMVERNLMLESFADASSQALPPGTQRFAKSPLKKDAVTPPIQSEKSNRPQSRDWAYKPSPLHTAPWTLDNWGLPPPIVNMYAEIGIRSLYPWQRACLFHYYENLSTSSSRNLLYSAPTSGGKTLVAEIIMLRAVLETGKRALYVVPFVSLAEEKSAALSKIAATVGKSVRCHAGHKGRRLLNENILVCTTEKANILVNILASEKRLHEICVVIVDEVHQIADTMRGYVMELLLTKLLNSSTLQPAADSSPVRQASRGTASASGEVAADLPSISVIGMSATLANVQELSQWMHGAHSFVTDFRPVPLSEYFVVQGTVFGVDGSAVRKLPPLQSALLERGLQPVDLDLVRLVHEAFSGGFQVLVFCASRKLCETTARMLHECLGIFRASAQPSSQPHQRLLSVAHRRSALLRKIRAACAGFVNKVLDDTILSGIAFHHAALSAEEKNLIEEAFRIGAVWALCCTTTLSTGVNLPARRVVFRGIRIANVNIEPTRYKQAAGRAGRKGLDSHGEAFIVARPAEQAIAHSLVSSHLTLVKSNFARDKRGMMRVVLEAIASKRIQTVHDVQCYICGTLLCSLSGYETVHIATKEALEFLEIHDFIEWETGKEIFLCTLFGEATVASSLAPDEALLLYAELSRAKNNFVMSSDLHLVFHCTPPFHGIEPDWSSFYSNIFSALPQDVHCVLTAIDIDEGWYARAAAVPPARSENSPLLLLHRRFFAALVLYDVVREVPLCDVARKFGIIRGELQHLMETAANFASMVSSFCERLNWWQFPPLFSKMAGRLQRGVEQDVLPLMCIPGLSSWRARELYKKGYRTVLSIAAASPEQLEAAISVKTPFRTYGAETVSTDVKQLVNVLQRGARQALAEETAELSDSIAELHGALLVDAAPATSARSSRAVQRMSHSPPSKIDLLEAHGEHTKLLEVIKPTSIDFQSVGEQPQVNFEWEMVSPNDAAAVAACNEKLAAEPLIAVGLVHHRGNDAAAFDFVVATSTTGFYLCDGSAFVSLIVQLLCASTQYKVLHRAQEQLRDMHLQGFVPLSMLTTLAGDDAKISCVRHLLDTLIADWMLHPDDRPGGRTTSVELLAKNHGVLLPMHGSNSRMESLAYHAVTMVLLMKTMLRRLTMLNLLDPFVRVEMPMVPVLVHMEACGIAFERKTYDLLTLQMEEKMRIITEECYEASGRSNWSLSSPKDVAHILFDVLHLPSLASTTDTKYFPRKRKRRAHLAESRSTKASVLKQLQKMFPNQIIPSHVREFRTLFGWIEKYIAPLLIAAAESRSAGASNVERIFGRFLHTATATGRLSMNDPNLQTIPHPYSFSLGSRIVEVKLRRAFVAPSGYVLLSADYSQIEMRLLAHFSQDEVLLASFRTGGDVFRNLGSKLFCRAGPDEVSDEERRYCKALCYGILYGKGSGSIAEELEISEEEADKIVSEFHSAYPAAHVFISSVHQRAARDGYVETILGRRRWLPFINSSNPRAKSASERMAINTLCQGSAADIIKQAMIDIVRYIASNSDINESSPTARLLLQIHDELLLEVRADALTEVARMVSKCMALAHTNRLRGVELAVKLRCGKDWDSLQPLQLQK